MPPELLRNLSGMSGGAPSLTRRGAKRARRERRERRERRVGEARRGEAAGDVKRDEVGRWMDEGKA